MSPSLRTVVATPSASRGSQTVLQTDPQPESSEPSATLRLRAEPNDAPHVRWAEDVVDNEGMGKKSSKVCCIYHKPHEPGDSDSGSSSSSDSEPDLSKAQRAGGGKGKGRKDEHNHDKKGDENSNGKGKAKERRPSPNAYERQPKHK